MSTSLIPQPSTEVAEKVDDSLLIDYLKSQGLAAKLTSAETSQFLQIAKAYQLNPFKREIYATKYGENSSTFSIIVGYETYLKRAERSGKLNGWKVEFTDWDDGELSATITIWRKDWDRPFEWEVFYSEQVQKKNDGTVNKFWQKRKQQLRKVAISQGMRLAFPDENGGLPYTKDELATEVEDTTYETVPNRTPAQQKVDAIAQPADQVHEAVVQSKPEPPKMTKLQSANLMKSLDLWHKQVGDLDSDPERCDNPIAWDVAATALGAIENMSREELVKLFRGLKQMAFNHGIDYDKNDKKFFAVEFSEPTNEELSQALANNG